MKKILITGAAGNLGIELIKQLIELHEYEITALDLKSLRSSKRIKKYSKKINIVYGDINDDFLVNSLVKDHDIVIHLAALLPPRANINSELTEIINVNGLINVVNAINKNNKNIFLLYPSSICVYGNKNNNENLTTKSKVEYYEDNYYANSKISAESIIKKSLSKYTIFRYSPIMGSKNIDSMMYDIPLNSKIEIITLKNAASAIVKSLEKLKEINKKTFNVSGGIKCQTTYKKFLKQFLKIRGLSFSIINSFLIEDRNYYCGYYSDSDKLNKIINYQTDDLKEYFKRLKSASKKRRIINKFLAVPFIMILRSKNEKR